MFCKYCGKELVNNAIFCSQCGKELKIPVSSKNASATSDGLNISYVPVTTPVLNPLSKKTKYVPTESSKSRLVAALLAFFFGDLGVHRFYVGKIFTGFIQLVLGLSLVISIICGVMDDYVPLVFLVWILWGIWVFVDFILILCGSFKDGKRLPITDWGL